MTTTQILRDAAVLVEHGWTRFWYARTANGVGVEINSREATCFLYDRRYFQNLRW